ncbi:MAG: hypothetical protein COB20_12210 [SAR86 cluster bacterium]|uniref:Transglutaminase-like domain-containing protein n=1 Tax=SAR86 cluster bacterium TaxID=2030880 RepID=A0A2A4X0A0_9GAMM|nr:MAG: hypothetical protein COB20_12210 [SAR86 cluster bacterium]
MATGLEKKLRKIFKRVNKNFVFARDPHGENWQMPPLDYDGKQRIEDDCDGFCLACRKLLREVGIPSRLVYCEIERRGHLVVEAQGWILDNLQDKVVANTMLRNYRWLRISGYEAGDPWHEIVG